MTNTQTPIRPISDSGLAEASSCLRRGGLVAFATETVYGLGADATNGRAVACIFEAKGRPRFNPLIVHVPDLSMVRRYVEMSEWAQAIADKFWPGPLTLVMKRKAGTGLSDLVSAGLPTVAVRIPAHGGARDLLRLVDRPVAAPSANASGRVSPTEASHVLASLDGKIDLVLDGGPCSVGLESTVLDVSAGGPTLLRPGGLAIEALEAAIGRTIQKASDKDPSPKSPGMLLKHYAPSLPIRLNAQGPLEGEVFLGFGTAEDKYSLSPTGDLREAASNLFTFLHQLDDPNHFQGIAIAPIPEQGLGIAINDRLVRAARR